MKMLFDMASVIQTGLRRSVSDDAYIVEHEGKGVKINPAEHGYEAAVGYMIWALQQHNLHPADAILVFEGRDSKKRRTAILQTYKASREKSAPQYYEEYRKCQNMVIEAFRRVGATCVIQDLAEGDDTLGYLAGVLQEDVVVVSNDGDLVVLAGVNRHGYEVKVMSGNVINKMPENVYESRHITLYKSLVGDTSDSVQGCKGFGAKAWETLLYTYGADGLDEVAAAIRDNKQNVIATFAEQNKCKLLAKIVDNWDAVRQAWQVVLIHSEWVNTRYYPLRIKAGVVLEGHDDERLRVYAQKKTLVTAANYPQALRNLKSKVERYPSEIAAFDLETAQPIDADDWLAEQGKDDGVDPLSSKICGFSISFGAGSSETYYVSVNHYDTENITMAQAREMIEVIHHVTKPIHNSYFELVLLANDQAKDEGGLWRDQWKGAGEFGMLPNIEDTLFMANYVDENSQQRGLKFLSKTVLGYEQTEFNTMRTFTTLEDGNGPYPGGRKVVKPLRQLKKVDGVQQYDKNGKPKTELVKVATPVLDEQGNPVVSKKRRFVDGKFQLVPEPKMTLEQVYESNHVYKMDELPAEVVFNYGCDDTVCTAAYYRYAKLHMMLDEHFDVYRKVEINAAYIHAHSYLQGFPIDLPELMEQRSVDLQTQAKAETVLHSYLTDHGWLGTAQPTYTPEITAAQVKEAYAIVFGLDVVDEEDDEDEDDEVEGKDPVMSMRVRKMDKVVELIREQPREGAELFAWHLEQLLDGEQDLFNKYIADHFDGKPKFKRSNKDMTKLLYEVMGMTVKVRNKVTPAMRKNGIREGNPKADALAIDYAIMEAKELGKVREFEVLQALKLITMVDTRMGLYYKTYPNFVHWKTGRLHSSHRQCSTNTRRASSANPNMQQMPKHPKIEGYASEFRKVVRPHKRGAVVVSLDFNAQELRVIADDSKDPNMLACYVGESLRDMHSITGSSIIFEQAPDLIKEAYEKVADQYQSEADRKYYAFVSLGDNNKTYKKYRSLGKKVNFTTEYGAMAPKLAATLMVSEPEAQLFIDARESAFAVAAEWKENGLKKQAHELGYVTTKMGAKRHLAPLLDSDDRSVSSKAERQAVNFRIQGSCAEMTKLAEGRLWRAGLFTGKYDAVCYGPIHDEIVASVMLEDLIPFIKEFHELMVMPYADMRVPIVSSISFGPNFYNQLEIGNEPDEVAIRAGIKELFEKYADEMKGCKFQDELVV